MSGAKIIEGLKEAVKYGEAQATQAKVEAEIVAWLRREGERAEERTDMALASALWRTAEAIEDGEHRTK